MGRPPLTAAALAVASTLCLCAPAMAAESVFDPPRTLATGASDTAVVVAPSGQAAIAWTGAGGVHVARRAAGQPAFGPPERVSAEAGSDLQIRRNARGDLAVAWMDGTPLAGGRVRVAVARVGQPFGSVQSPGTIPPEPPEPGQIPAPEPTVIRASLALAGDGRATVAFSGGASRGAVATRTPDGPFGDLVLLDGGADILGNPQAAASPTGPVTVVWEGPTPGAPEGLESVFAADIGADGGLGPRRAISDPALDAGFGFSDPTIAVGPEGEAIVVWGGAEAPRNGAFNLFPTRVDVAERDAAGRWAPPHRLVPGQAPFAAKVSAAFNARSDAVVTGDSGGTVDLTFRPAGGAFGPVRKEMVNTPSLGATPVALDALGISVQIAGRSRDLTGGPGSPLYGFVREQGAGYSQRFALTPPGEGGFAPDIGTDAAGRGVAVWISPDGGQGRVRYSTYTAAAPAVAGLRLTRGAFVLAASRPAVLGITVRARRDGRVRSVSQTAVARPAANTIAFTRRMKRFVARKGRYSVQVATRDRGPRVGTTSFRVTVKARKKKAAAKRR